MSNSEVNEQEADRQIKNLEGELSKAVTLLTRICEHIHCCRYAGNESTSYHKDINYMEDIEGLAEWWEANGPEGKQRRAKIETIVDIIRDEMLIDNDKAKKILEALEGEIK